MFGWRCRSLDLGLAYWARPPRWKLMSDRSQTQDIDRLLFVLDRLESSRPGHQLDLFEVDSLLPMGYIGTAVAPTTAVALDKYRLEGLRLEPP